METIAFGWATLVWWTWPLLVLTVSGSVYLVYAVTMWQERRRERSEHHGRYPCLRHLGERSWGHAYCGMLDGHTGDCGSMVTGGWTKEHPGD